MRLTEQFTVHVKVVPGAKLHPVDALEGPRDGDIHTYDAVDSEDALDQFHESVPIKCLDDYDVDCEKSVIGERYV